jgi:hypothetical protein
MSLLSFFFFIWLYITLPAAIVTAYHEAELEKKK